MAGYIGTQAVSVNTTSATISDDLAVGDDATIAGTLGVTGVLTTTAATVFNGGFAANDGSTITTADNSVQLTLISTDADAGSGPIMNFYRNSSSPADGDSIGVFEFIGRNDNSQDVTAIQIETKMTDVSDGDEDASFSMGIRRAGAFIDALSFDPTETVFNDTGANVDFRVEGDTDQHALFVEGETDRVSIGSNDPPMKLTVRNGSANSDIVKFTGDGTGAGLTISTAATTRADDTVIFKASDAFGELSFVSDNTEVLRLNKDNQATLTNGLTLTDGNLVVANGHGIDFGAQTDANSVSGTTVGAELLDHYEEGTWTPALLDGTSVTVNDAHYTRIGRVVHIGMSIVGASNSSSNAILFTGLPFGVINGNDQAFGLTVANTSVGTDNIYFAFLRNTSQIGCGTNANTDIATSVLSTKKLCMSGYYFVA